MAARDIQRHFKGLRADTGRRKGRPDPFATGFEDDSDEEERRSRSTTSKQAAAAAKTGTSLPTARDLFRDSENVFLDPPKRTDRRPSPAPATLSPFLLTDAAGGRRGSLDAALLPKHLQGKAVQIRGPRSAVAQAAGSLALLDDSSSDEDIAPPTRVNRYPSPAPRKRSDDGQPAPRSATPRGTREGSTELSQAPAPPSRHSVASAFAGTKYLQDSDSDSDKESSPRRSNSDAIASDRSPSPETRRNEIKRVDKPKPQNGGGVSWRAFSEGRVEQRTKEIEALQASLKQRGKSISFGSHALTDDGNRIPVRPSPEQIFAGARGMVRKGSRGKSPPRRAEDTEPTKDELADGSGLGLYDPTQFKTNPFTGRSAIPIAMRTMAGMLAGAQMPQMSSLTSGSTLSPSSENETASPSSDGGLENSISSLNLKATVLAPQTIHEGVPIDVSKSPVLSPLDMTSPISRDPSTRSLRSYSRSRPTRIPNGGSRRSSRRSMSANPSMSPAQTFLSSWSREVAESTSEPKPDDEGQSIGLDNEYIIGRRINSGGFGVVKEVHTMSEAGETLMRAVKIVLKQIPGKNDFENDKAQQELEHEISIWRHLKHPHVLGLHAVYDTDYATFCVMDLNVGGTLFDIVRRSRGSASENDGRRGLDPVLAKSYSFQLACALRYLHEDIRICHRDVKLENCLIDMTVSNADISGGFLRLCDFGLADFLHDEQNVDEVMMSLAGSPRGGSSSANLANLTTSSIIGTLEYASPRGLSVHRKLYETAGDMWAFGVIVYVLCTGELPFRHSIPSKTVELIMQGEWDENVLVNATSGNTEIQELVRGCLEKDDELRFTISEVLRSPWFEGCRETTDEEDRGVWR